MIVATSAQKLRQLYEKDETTWLDRSAALIRAGRLRDLDRRNLAQHLVDMAQRDRREVFSRLSTLVMHLLKWDYQPERRSASWEKTLLHQRRVLRSVLDRKSLAHHAEQILDRAYEIAVRHAVEETHLAKDFFPQTCPYTLEQLLTAEFRKR